MIWIVQLAHYPLQRYVDKEAFKDFQASHLWRISLVVGPLMLLEAGSAVWLLYADVPQQIQTPAWIGIALVLLIWIATATLSVPCHWKLEHGWNEAAWRRLVATNWVRTVAWSARLVVVAWLLLEWKTS